MKCRANEPISARVCADQSCHGDQLQNTQEACGCKISGKQINDLSRSFNYPSLIANEPQVNANTMCICIILMLEVCVYSWSRECIGLHANQHNFYTCPFGW